mmetsp:Transcript_169856/g.412871  ORF Transcript_169856/g.412871 Transcript_169856/m.412871 type:complete len:338 (+) Transcript_169856:1156-2169(+)
MELVLVDREHFPRRALDDGGADGAALGQLEPEGVEVPGAELRVAVLGHCLQGVVGEELAAEGGAMEARRVVRTEAARPELRVDAEHLAEVLQGLGIVGSRPPHGDLAEGGQLAHDAVQERDLAGIVLLAAHNGAPGVALEAQLLVHALHVAVDGLAHAPHLREHALEGHESDPGDGLRDHAGEADHQPDGEADRGQVCTGLLTVHAGKVKLDCDVAGDDRPLVPRPERRAAAPEHHLRAAVLPEEAVRVVALVVEGRPEVLDNLAHLTVARPLPDGVGDLCRPHLDCPILLGILDDLEERQDDQQDDDEARDEDGQPRHQNPGQALGSADAVRAGFL